MAETRVSAAPVKRVLRLLKRGARRLLGRPQPPTVVAMHPFDTRHGVDTSGLLEPDRLRTGHANDAFNTAYFGVPPSRFLHAIDAWRNTAETPAIEVCRFIDIGCGKGRALLLASCMPFRDVIGIELHPRLAATAKANQELWRQREEVRADVSVVCGDAVSALPEFLQGPVLIYLYNPFRSPVLRALLREIAAAHAMLSATIDILYLYPEHEEVFAEFPQMHLVWHRPIGLSPDDANDGLSAATDPCSLYRLLPMAAVNA